MRITSVPLQVVSATPQLASPSDVIANASQWLSQLDAGLSAGRTRYADVRGGMQGQMGLLNGIFNDATLSANVRARAAVTVAGYYGIVAQQERSGEAGRSAMTRLHNAVALDPSNVVAWRSIATSARAVQMHGMRFFIESATGLNSDRELTGALAGLERLTGSVMAQATFVAVMQDCVSRGAPQASPTRLAAANTRLAAMPGGAAQLAQALRSLR